MEPDNKPSTYTLTSTDLKFLKRIAGILQTENHYHFSRVLRTIIGKLEGNHCIKSDCIIVEEQQKRLEDDFKKKARDKFLAGAMKHSNENWEDIDHIKELKEELLDAYNYLKEALRQEKVNKEHLLSINKLIDIYALL